VLHGPHPRTSSRDDERRTDGMDAEVARRDQIPIHMMTISANRFVLRFSRLHAEVVASQDKETIVPSDIIEKDCLLRPDSQPLQSESIERWIRFPMNPVARKRHQFNPRDRGTDDRTYRKPSTALSTNTSNNPRSMAGAEPFMSGFVAASCSEARRAEVVTGARGG
jgi:hypothetical protein